VHAKLGAVPNVQIRNVPPAVHERLKQKARQAGMSLSEYLLAEITEIADDPTIEEMIERLRRLPAVTTTESASEIIRRDRDSR
jgi:hypothetical protein